MAARTRWDDVLLTHALQNLFRCTQADPDPLLVLSKLSVKPSRLSAESQPMDSVPQTSQRIVPALTLMCRVWRMHF